MGRRAFHESISMPWLHMLALAVVQGVAEFLPISSSGHLVILGALLGTREESATVEILLHTGTLASIVVVYWHRIWSLLWADRRVLPLLVVGTVPAATVGLVIKTQAEEVLKNPLLAGCMLLVTGCMLMALRFLPKGDTDYKDFSWTSALVVGCFQAFAILPGISRSGSTIVGGRLLGLRSDDAVTFSFLLAIPAILGATLLTVKDLVNEDPNGQRVALLLTGAAVAFVVGLAALKWLIHWSRTGKLYWFSAWCFPMGFAVILLWWWGMLPAEPTISS